MRNRAGSEPERSRDRMTSREPRYRSADHQMMSSSSWSDGDRAQEIFPGIYMSHGNANSYLVSGPGGDVVINTGYVLQGQAHRERYEEALGRSLAVAKIIFTQSHTDHVGGWQAFADPGAEMIAQANIHDVVGKRQALASYFGRRGQIWGPKLHAQLRLDDPARMAALRATPDPEPLTLVGDSLELQVGARRFEVFAVPGGETIDGLAVWMPAERVAFIGYLTGPMWKNLPNLTTIRGDPLRSAEQFVRDVDRVLALRPALLVTGEQAIQGEERIQTELGQIRDAVQFIRDETVKGMNQGKDLFTLMREIRVPEALGVGEGRGRTHWLVRAVWEMHTGWFRFDSTADLYWVPQRAVAGDLVELAGGPDVLSQRAAEHAAAERPLEALRLVELALAVDPAHRQALEAQREALLTLIDWSEGRSYDELRWLETQLDGVQAALGDHRQFAGYPRSPQSLQWPYQ